VSRHLVRCLSTAYGALLVWLAYCAVQSALNGAVGACLAFLIGSLLAVTAFIREGALEDALHREAVQAERDARPADTTPAVAACCEPWWTSCGFDHDPTCPNHHRSAA
jgi:hypothetical protein